MKIQIQQLAKSFASKIFPIYLISSDEHLLLQEARDTIRKHAVAAGYNERETFYIESGFNWDKMLSSINNLSLFGGHTLVELHLKSKITDIGSKILQTYAKKPPPNKILLITSTKPDASQQKTAWFKAIDTYGAVVPITTIDSHQLPTWIAKRLKQFNLTTDEYGIKLLTDHSLGNLLSSAQEIEKLHLLYDKGFITSEQIIASITDNSRFNVFTLLDNALNGEITQLIRVLDSLKTEEIEPAIILWAIARELRLLINISFDLEQGTNLEQAMTKNNVWNTRKNLIKKTISYLNLEKLQTLLKQASHIDLLIKGANNQHLLWHEINRICFSLANVSLPCN